MVSATCSVFLTNDLNPAPRLPNRGWPGGRGSGWWPLLGSSAFGGSLGVSDGCGAWLVGKPLTPWKQGVWWCFQNVCSVFTGFRVAILTVALRPVQF